MYINIRVITADTYRAHGGVDLTDFNADPAVFPAAARGYRLLKKATLKDLAARVGEETKTDPRRIRFWCMVNRQNKTVRPDAPILGRDIALEDAHTKLAGSKSAELRLWAETAEEVDAEGEPIWPASQNTQNGTPPRTDLMVLFLKYFDVDNQTLSGIGHIYVSREKKVEDLVPIIMKTMGWPEKLPNGEKAQLKLFEVSVAAHSRYLNANVSYRRSNLV